MSSLLIQQYQIGPLDNFLYLLGDSATKEMAVVDPAWDPDFLSDEATRLGYTITKVLLTHGHHDHVNGLKRILERHNVPVFISRHEMPALRPKTEMIDLNDGDTVSVGKINFKVLHTPGHTPGCQCFLTENQMISGDTLFVDGIGRCDLPGGDPKVMYQSLQNVIMKLPDNTIIYPGHNYGPTPSDTIGHQKRTNPYLQCDSLEQFIDERM